MSDRSPSLSDSASPRAARRLAKEQVIRENLARDLLLSSLLSVSAIPLESFSNYERKMAATHLRKATAHIRALRKMIPGPLQPTMEIDSR